MAKNYTYRALDQRRNKVVKGSIQAFNEKALEQTLADSNMVLISFKEVKKGLFSSAKLFNRIKAEGIF